MKITEIQKALNALSGMLSDKEDDHFTCRVPFKEVIFFITYNGFRGKIKDFSLYDNENKRLLFVLVGVHVEHWGEYLQLKIDQKLITKASEFKLNAAYLSHWTQEILIKVNEGKNETDYIHLLLPLKGEEPETFLVIIMYEKKVVINYNKEEELMEELRERLLNVLRSYWEVEIQKQKNKENDEKKRINYNSLIFNIKNLKKS